MSKPLVSVVVASYNHADFVSVALGSVAAQDYAGPIQLIVTDDASSDDSQEAIRRALEETGQQAQTILHSENKGVCATFNAALERAEGEYVCFMAADDWMRADRVSVQVAALRQSPDSALCYSNMVMVRPGGEPTGTFYSEILPDSWGFDCVDNAFSRLLVHNWIPAPSVMMRTECLRSVGGYDETLSFEDHEMWLRLTSRWGVTFCPQALVFYRDTPGSLGKQLGSTRVRQKYEDTMRMLRRHRPPADQGISLTLEYENARLAFLLGSAPQVVRPTFAAYAAAHPRGVMPWLYLLLSGLRVPGRAIERSRSAIRR